MNRSIPFISILLTLFSIIGCEEEDFPPVSEKHQLLIGSWKIVSSKSEYYRADGSYIGEDPVLVVANEVRYTRDKVEKMQSSWPYAFEEKGGKSYVVTTYPDNSRDSVEVALLTDENLTLVHTKVLSDGGSKEVNTEKLIRQRN